MCEAFHSSNASFPPATARTKVFGVCDDGYTSVAQPFTFCGEDGKWADVIFNGCVSSEYCEADLKPDGHAVFKQSGAMGETVEGFCQRGFEPSGNYPPTRRCMRDGQWGTVRNPCVRNTSSKWTAGAIVALVFILIMLLLVVGFVVWVIRYKV